jgi:protein TonB
MVARPRVSPRQNTEPRTAPAVVLPFPARVSETTLAEAKSASLAPAPATGERPTLLIPKVREWLRVTLIVSLVIHAVVYLAFQLRFHDDLERAAGAAAALASQGTITIPVEVVADVMLPSAPSPTNATAEDAKPEEADELTPTPPDPAPVVMPKELAEIELPPPPEPVSAALEQAEKLALPDEQTAPPRLVEAAPVPRAPAAVKAEQAPVPKKREQKKVARSVPSSAASPSRAAASSSNGSSGAGGATDAGGIAAISSYRAQVFAHLARFRVYPPEARDRGITGIARVRITLARDGRVLSVVPMPGGAARILDDAAVDTVRRASPFPPFPASISWSQGDLDAPIGFDLR